MQKKRWYEHFEDSSHTEMEIKGFFGEYRWLSNFELCDIIYRGEKFTSSEAAFQAAKCKYSEDFKKFTNLSPSESKKLGRSIDLIDNWDNIKESIMKEILLYKFTHNENLREKLIQTGNKFLEETNWWNDTYWGVCKGKGQNRLGKILMDIRTELTHT